MQIDREVLETHEITLEVVERHQSNASMELAALLRSEAPDLKRLAELVDALHALDTIAFFIAADDEEYGSSEAQEAVQ